MLVLYIFYIIGDYSVLLITLHKYKHYFIGGIFHRSMVRLMTTTTITLSTFAIRPEHAFLKLKIVEIMYSFWENCFANLVLLLIERTIINL